MDDIVNISDVSGCSPAKLVLPLIGGVLKFVMVQALISPSSDPPICPQEEKFKNLITQKQQQNGENSSEPYSRDEGGCKEEKGSSEPSEDI
eukprot:12567995-Ditylum_brightwellii.AAC.1